MKIGKAFVVNVWREIIKMITETLHEFTEFEYLPEFITQYVFHTKYKSDPDYLVYIFACDTYHLFDKNINVEKTVEKYGSLYEYLKENNLYDGEDSIIYDFINWLPESYYVNYYDDTNDNRYFKVSLLSYNYEEDGY
jgi:hypothetical protein